MPAELTIPGLEVPRPPATDIEAQVEATIDELRQLELLLPRHHAQVGLCRLLAHKLGLVAERGQAYGVAMLARELREALAALPAPEKGEDDRDEFDKLAAAVREAELGNRPEPEPAD